MARWPQSHSAPTSARNAMKPAVAAAARATGVLIDTSNNCDPSSRFHDPPVIGQGRSGSLYFHVQVGVPGILNGGPRNAEFRGRLLCLTLTDLVQKPRDVAFFTTRTSHGHDLKKNQGFLEIVRM